MPAALVLAKQSEIGKRSPKSWSDVNCLIGSDAVRDLGKRNLNTDLSLQVVAIDTFIRLKSRMRQQFRARNHAVLMSRRGIDIGYLDVEILFQGEINRAVQRQLLLSRRRILRLHHFILRTEYEEQQ